MVAGGLLPVRCLGAGLGLLLAGAAADAFAGWWENLSADGFVETFQAVPTRAPDESQASRTRLRLQLFGGDAQHQLFARATAEREFAFDESRVELDEAYLDLVGTGWDLRLGRQVVIWGRADGLRILDRVSPSDLSEFITRELDEIRLGIDAIKVRRLAGASQWELTWAPRFRAGRPPEGVWALPSPIPAGQEAAFAPTEEPGDGLDDGVFALRWSHFGAGLDLSISLLRTFEDLPSLERRRTRGGGLLLVPRHRRLDMLGVGVARPWRSFVFRGEAVYLRGQGFEPSRWDADLFRKALVQWMAGFDWTPNEEWTLTLQLADDWLPGHEPGMAADAHTPVMTLRVVTDLLRETLALSNLTFWQPTARGLYNRFELDYAVSDRFQVLAGLDLFDGESGPFAFYEDKSQLWIKLRYSF